jgi:hypothetical protein
MICNVDPYQSCWCWASSLAVIDEASTRPSFRTLSHLLLDWTKEKKLVLMSCRIGNVSHKSVPYQLSHSHADPWSLPGYVLFCTFLMSIQHTESNKDRTLTKYASAGRAFIPDTVFRSVKASPNWQCQPDIAAPQVSYPLPYDGVPDIDPRLNGTWPTM